MNQYRKLPGRGRPIGFAASPSRYSLWVAPDHLLSLESSIGSESYRRFYFRDIEAFTLRRTSRRQAFNWFFIVAAALFGGPFAVIATRNPGEIGWWITALVLGGIWLVAALINTVRGPTCITHVRTAVQIEMLPSLGRMSTAQKVLATMKPLIEAAQGASPDLSAAAGHAAGTAPPLDPGLTREPTFGTGLPLPARHENGNYHLALFTLLIALGAFSFWDGRTSSKVPFSLGLIGSLLGMWLLIFALRRQINSDLPSSLRRVTWMVLGLYVVGLFASFVLSFIFAVRHQEEQPPTDPFVLRGEPGYSEIVAAGGAASAVVAVLGLSLTFGHRRSSRAPSESP